MAGRRCSSSKGLTYQRLQSYEDPGVSMSGFLELLQEKLYDANVPLRVLSLTMDRRTRRTA